MPVEYRKATLAVLWVLVVSAGGFFSFHVASVSGWIVLASLALLPPLVMLQLWNDPPKTMSERINEGRR
jgi:hypothetical protein